MTQASVDPTQAISSADEKPEPADNNSYRNLAFGFIIGMAVIIVFFVVMLMLMAGAS
jgi:capsular polysaccharide biosynthesis protein